MIRPIFGIVILTFTLISCTQSLPGKSKEEFKASDIIKMLNKGQNLDLTNKIITGDLDFSMVKQKAKVHSVLSQSVIKTSVSFTKCKFLGKVICSHQMNGLSYQSVFMQNLIFNTCEFNSLTDFQSVTVFGVVSFSGSIFIDMALFNGFYSHSKASYFGQITAEKEFSMQDALFIGSCDFFKSNFKSGVSFQGSCINGLFNFSTVQCESRADFSKTRLHSSTFNYTLFAGPLRFNQFRSLGMADFIQVNFNQDAIFTNAIFYEVSRFSESKVNAGFDFSSTVFYHSAPVLDKIVITDKKLFKPGSVIQQASFALPE